MQRKFLSGLFLMVLLNVLIKPVAIFGIDAEIQNRVGAADYGIYFSLLNFSFLFNILMDIGINNFTTKSVAQYPRAALSYFGKILVFRFMLFILYALVTISLAVVLGWETFEVYLLSFLVLNQFFVVLIAYARSHFGGLLMFKTDAIINVLDRFLLIIFCGILLYAPVTDTPFKIEWFVWIQTACYGTTCIVALSILLRKIGMPKLRYKRLFSYALLRKSFPYALLILLMMLYTRVDSVMIERIHPNGKSQAGFYAQGFRLLDAFFMFAMIFSNLLFPLFSKMLAQRDNIVPLLNMAGKLLVGGAFGLAIVCFFHPYEILDLIYENDVFESSTSFQLIMMAFVGMCTSLIFGTLLTANGSLKFLNTVSAIGILVNIGINAFLIPEYGANGAAFATLVTQTVVSLTQVVYVLFSFHLKPKLTIVVQFVLYLIAVTSLNYWFPVDSNWSLLGVALLSAGLLPVFRLIDFRELKSLFLSRTEKDLTDDEIN